MELHCLIFILYVFECQNITKKIYEKYLHTKN